MYGLIILPNGYENQKVVAGNRAEAAAGRSKTEMG
jgi:hypothetical protein